jgi:ribonuclease BN (tRNA processing enzyme)
MGRFERFAGEWTELPLEGTSCADFEIAPRPIPEPRGGLPLDPAEDIVGTSLGGVDTSFTVPKLGITLDAGESVVDVEPERNVFISHTDHDHFNGLPALLCLGSARGEPYEVYLSELGREKVQEALGSVEEIARSGANFHFVGDGEISHPDPDTRYEFFEVPHSPTSLGISVSKRGEGGEWQRELTYTGDISLRDLKGGGPPQMRDTRTLVTECSFPTELGWIGPIRDALDLKHSSISDVRGWARRGGGNNPDHLVLVHSMATPPGPLPERLEPPPLMVACFPLKWDIRAHLRGEGFESYYLTGCRTALGVRRGPARPTRCSGPILDLVLP